MSDCAILQRRIEEEAVGFVDFRVSDLIGRFRHITVPAERITDELLSDGIGFDGSNYGYRQVSGSDMVLVPDPSTAYVEERSGERILTLIADICDAKTRAPAAIDPRGIAASAERLAVEREIADEIVVSPEFEFYVFREARYGCISGRSIVEIDPVRNGDVGSDGPDFSAYHAPIPRDRLFDVRCEICRQLEAAGVPVKYHHHEVGRLGQQEIELGFGRLVRMADATLIVKSIVRNVAAEIGLSATFLPKPVHGEAGSGMHLHQYIVRNGRNQFRDGDGLSERALCYIGGILTHGRSLLALTNPTTNSYRRLVPGFEAPLHFVFGSANRTAAIRVPAYARGEATRFELRTMDATCNPYLAFAAIVMAGLDGIERGLNAQRLGMGPFDSDLHERGAGGVAPRTLDEALRALEEDHRYLLSGGVFSEDGIEHWIRVKQRECTLVAEHPHPMEFSIYYDL